MGKLEKKTKKGSFLGEMEISVSMFWCCLLSCLGLWIHICGPHRSDLHMMRQFCSWVLLDMLVGYDNFD